MSAPGETKILQFNTAQASIATSAIAAPANSHFQASKRLKRDTTSVERIT
jgi:hypothetical protein